MLDYDLVLKADELFLVGEIQTDGSGESGKGLYLRDTRHLCRYDVKLGGERLDVLAIHPHDATSATAVMANLWMPDVGGAPLPKHMVMVREQIELNDRLCVAYELKNFGLRPLSMTFAMEFTSDFRDIFDIRGFARTDRGLLRAPHFDDSCFVLGYEGRDGLLAETRAQFNQPVRLAETIETQELPDGTTIDIPGVFATFDLDLSPDASWNVVVEIVPLPADQKPLRQLRHATRFASVETNHIVLNNIHDQSVRDLTALETPFGHGSLPAAGIPWFVAPFGRDSLIVGLQTLHLHPEAAIQTLTFLASLQGENVDAYTDEAPGKILHEMRYGEMARLGEVPHLPYYGTVDATPLFVWLAAEVFKWTCDDDLYRRLKPHVLRAIDWIDRYGDVDGDGLVEYSTLTTSTGTISHKVWKDSWDSLHDPAGNSVSGLITPVEVQGYVFAGYSRLADVADFHGDAEWAVVLRRKAEAVREMVESLFWMDEEGCYAQALGPDKHPISAVSSNAAQLFSSGLPSPERAKRMSYRFLASDMLTGWGMRTLSSKMSSYNPMSYHNGSIWPHDNSLIISGLYRYGEHHLGVKLVEGLLEAAAVDPILRLPELYCGFDRDDAVNDAPVAYPVSCNPQAWASGALPFVVRSIAGLEASPRQNSLLVSPRIPCWLDRIEFKNLRVLGQEGSLLIERVKRGEKEIRVTASGLNFDVVS